jgi:hypothetical protein
MSNTYGGTYVVAATKDGNTEYWAAATLREDAADTVGSQLGPGWTLTLTDKRLTPEAIAELKMRANCIRKLDRVP